MTVKGFPRRGDNGMTKGRETTLWRVPGWTGESAPATAAVLATLLIVTAVCMSTFVVHRNLIFDDSYITYRYARNLAEGHGITWNIGEAPVEGYTNFLLVLVLAPFIRLGVDPLFATRVLSAFASVGLVFLCYRLSRKEDADSDRSSALIAALSFPAATQTAYLCMVGLETVLFAFAVFAAFALVRSYLKGGQEWQLAASNAVAFVAFLLRPEAAFLVLASALVILVPRLRGPGGMRFATRCWGLPFAVPAAFYFGWKFAHFGALLPASFYVKAGGVSWFSYSGIGSVSSFLSEVRVFIALALAAVALRKGMGKAEAVALLFVAFYVAFYLRVDTLMDTAGRFLYPAAVFVWYLASPAIRGVFRYLLGVEGFGPIRAFLIPAAFVLVFHGNVWADYVTVRRALHGDDRHADKRELMQKEYRVAQTLSRYEHIRDILIAFSDAGVIPYFTQARFLDVVGLNDRTISRERDLPTLVNYFFARRPTLVIHPANKDFTWIAYDHGPMGNYPLWSADPRWDNYAYAGTIVTSSEYDMHLFVRRDYERFKEFSVFLRRDVADRFYDPFRILLGTSVTRAVTPESAAVAN